MNDTAAHVDKSTLSVSIYDPEHAQRVTTPLFARTRDQILAKEPLCWLCGKSKDVVGPLELHHGNVERMFAEVIDWPVFAVAAKAGEVGWTDSQREMNRDYDWDAFLAGVAADPMHCYTYVDDMHINGVPLCKPHHTGADEGVHNMDYPRWLAQRYAKADYKYSDSYTIDSEADREAAIAEEDQAA